jgi:hypothetical protein
VVSRTLLIGAALVVATPVAAQQMVSSGADPQVKYQATMFEGVLRAAVQHAGERLAERVSSIVPGVQLFFENEAIIRTVPTPEGPVFDVQIPEINGAGLSLLRIMQAQPPASPPPSATGAQPVSTPPPGRVTASSIPAPDPMTSSPIPAGFDADKEYSTYAREALIDAMLDNSGGLPLVANQRLEITAGGLDVTGSGALAVNNSRRLVLVISGADLALFHEGKITRAEAKQRIKEYRY